MRVWRICRREHAATAFSGQGAIAHAGRWHHRGTRVVYASESRALAALEQLVHMHRPVLPPGFVCFGVDIPDRLEVMRMPPAQLPVDWHTYPAPEELRDIGTAWVDSAASVCLEVPSAVVPGECNYLLNPVHPDFALLGLHGPENFVLDERLIR